jgi:hypothetical protein
MRRRALWPILNLVRLTTTWSSSPVLIVIRFSLLFLLGLPLLPLSLSGTVTIGLFVCLARGFSALLIPGILIPVIACVTFVSAWLIAVSFVAGLISPLISGTTVTVTPSFLRGCLGLRTFLFGWTGEQPGQSGE